MDRTDEATIQIGILAFLVDGQSRHNQEIKAAVERNTDLTLADKVRAPGRQNEAKWQQLVNNALAPSRTNSLYSQGFVENAGPELHRITPAGIAKARSNEVWAEVIGDIFCSQLALVHGAPQAD